MDLVDGVGDDDIPRGVAGDVQRLENRHAARDEGAEGTGESRDRTLELHRPEDRHLQLHPVDRDTAALGHAEGFPARVEHRPDDEDDEPLICTQRLMPMTTWVIAGSGLSPSISWKMRSNRGTITAMRKTRMATAMTMTMMGVDHRRDDAVLQLLRLFLVLGETDEDELEDPAELAGLDHVDVELVEDLGCWPRLSEEGGTARDGIGESG